MVDVTAQDGLDVGGFLLMAVAHLRKAREKIARMPYFSGHARVSYWLHNADIDIRDSLKLLNEKKEQTDD